MRDLVGNSNTDLQTSLLEGDVFTYAHLVKFEKPEPIDGVIPARSATSYTYITDASFDIDFDDGSIPSSQASAVSPSTNGVQTYRANRLLSVSNITETIQARASSFTINLAANALGTIADGVSYSISGNQITLASLTWTDLGFIEGHEIKLVGGSNNGLIIRLESFQTNNTVATFTTIVGSPQNGTDTSDLELNNRELSGLTIDKSASGYARYINREVFVYKAHINPEDGTILSKPYLVFKGIINSGKLTENTMGQSQISWNVTSHWGDFISVNGRITSDTFHRALNGQGVPDIDALVRPAYANDFGFMHSEQAINLIAIYQVKETRYKLKKKSSWFGLKKSYEQVEYEVEVDREADLRFNLQAKYLPVVYGVQQVDSIPIFVDTDVDNSAEIYVIYAICEGEVHSIFDIYFDDQNSVCLNEADSDTRGQQTAEETISVLCTGRMDRGDVLLAEDVSDPAQTLFADYSDANWNLGFGAGVGFGAGANPFYNGILAAFLATGASQAQSQGIGIYHETGRTFDDPIDTKLIFHSGKPNQTADDLLVNKASQGGGAPGSGGFKLQQEYYKNDKVSYWGPNHQLLDTAYVVAKYTVSENEVNIPELDFVVKGKLIECYNYDYGYREDPTKDSTAAYSAFDIGDTIKFYDEGGTEVSAAGTATLAYKYKQKNEKNEDVIRIRLKDPIPASVPSRFSIAVDGAPGTKIHLVKYDHIYNQGDVGALPQAAIQVATAGTNVGSQVQVDAAETIASLVGTEDVFITIIAGEYGQTQYTRAQLQAMAAPYANQNTGNTGNTAGSNVIIDNVGNAADANTNDFAVVQNAVVLGAGSSSVADFYNGAIIEVTSILGDGSTKIQTRKIVDYIVSVGSPAVNIALVDEAFDPQYFPNSGDKYRIFAPGDIRVSTNPVMQLLDYMTSTRYGRSLELDQDINLDSFKETAYKADTRSKAWVTTTDTPALEAVYKYETNGRLQFQGTVSQLGSGQIQFEDIIGKLGRKWNDWYSWETDDLIWHEGKAYEIATPGAQTTPPSGPGLSSINLTKVSGTGPSTIAVSTSVTDGADGQVYVRNPFVKYNDSLNYIDGYSLYDSDDVKYWRYLGWEEHDQEWVTRHQTNIVVDTSKSVFDNVNGILNHFNGILRYSAGKYEVDIRSQKDTPQEIIVGSDSYFPTIIEEDDIIGQINLEDPGTKGTFNSVSCNIPDPQNRFESRSVTFLNSDYLKEDRNIPKKGNVKSPGVTNYFNARINARQYLEESRYGMKVSFTMPPKGYLLQAGEVIEINNERLGFSNKPFRITNLTLTENCLVQITAEEHNENAYLIEGIESGPLGSDPPTFSGSSAPKAVNDLTATTNKIRQVELSWTTPVDATNPERSFKNGKDAYEIYRAEGPDFDGDLASSPPYGGAILLATVQANSYVDPIDVESLGDNSVSYYYWIRVKRLYNDPLRPTSIPKTVFSLTYPELNASPNVPGIQGTADPSIRPSSIVFLYTAKATVPNGPDSTFPNTLVSLDTGKIISDTSSPPVFFVDGETDINGDSWFIAPASANATGDEKLWVIAATANGIGSTDPIVWDEWTAPVQFTGTDGFNQATIELFQANNDEANAPALPADLSYNFETGALSSPFPWSRNRMQPSRAEPYVWRISAAAISQETTTTIDGINSSPAGEDWSDAIIVDRFIEDGITLELTNDTETVGADEGSPVTGLSVTTTAQVFRAGVEITNQWDFEATLPANLTCNGATSATDPVAGTGANGNVFEVTRLETAYTNGNVIITASPTASSPPGDYEGADSRSRSFTVSRINNGEVGVSYRLIPSPGALGYDVNTSPPSYTGGGGANNNEVTFTAKKISQGSPPVTDQTGYWSQSGGTATIANNGTESSITVTASGSNDITVNFYLDSGLTQLVDTETVPVVPSGPEGPAGESVTGDPGEIAPRVVQGFVYSTQNAVAPDAGATATTYTFSTGAFTNLNGNWSLSPPSITFSTETTVYYAPFSAVEGINTSTNTRTDVATEGGSGAAGTLTFGSVAQGTVFTGLVTFREDPTNGDILQYLGSDLTEIYGGYIKTGTIEAAALNLVPVESVAGVTGATITSAQLSSAGISLTSDLGDLATQSNVNLATQVTGTLATSAGGTGSTVGPYGYSTAANFISSEGVFLTSSAGDLATLDSIAANSAQITGLLQSAYNSTTFDTNAAAAAPVQSVAGLTGTVTTAQLGSAGLFLQSAAGALATLDSVDATSAEVTGLLASATNQSSFDSAAASAAPVQTSDIANFIELSGTAITSGKIVLSTTGLIIDDGSFTVGSQSVIVQDTTGGNNAIAIYDGGTLRVKLGKL